MSQGIIGIECPEAATDVRALLEVLNHPSTRVAMDAERAFALRLDGSCQSPIAAHALLDGETLKLDGLVAEPDGSRLFRDTVTGRSGAAQALGESLADRLLTAGAGPLLERLRTA